MISSEIAFAIAKKVTMVNMTETDIALLLLKSSCMVRVVPFHPFCMIKLFSLQFKLLSLDMLSPIQVQTCREKEAYEIIKSFVFLVKIDRNNSI